MYFGISHLVYILSLIFPIRFFPHFSGWLRQHCMNVFHYLAHELKDTSLFDNEMEESLTTGAVYNDFDGRPMDNLLSLEETASFSFSQSSMCTSTPIPVKSSGAIKEALDNAIMEADKREGINYEHLHWESPYFDNESEVCNRSYCEKVFHLATNKDGAWDEITISAQAKTMFHRRLRTQWDAPDSVFDAWLIRRGWERAWFDNHLFSVMYPNFEINEEDSSDFSNSISKENKNSKENIMNVEDEEESEDGVVMKPPTKRRCMPRIIHSTSESESQTDDEREKEVKKKEDGLNLEGTQEHSETNDTHDTRKDEEEEDSKDNIKFMIHKVVNEVIFISSDED